VKKLLNVAAMAMFAACSTNPSAPASDSTKIIPDSGTVTRPIQSPYNILYSSQFVIDDPKNAESLLTLWKDYDNGNLSAHKDLFADSVRVELSGFTLYASRDSVIAVVQAGRSSLKNAVDQVNAVMAVKSTDKNEHWALIWGTETDTYKNGKVDSVRLQETWRFNQAGKADYMMQFRQELTPPKHMK
jgi:hypothetical protein